MVGFVLLRGALYLEPGFCFSTCVIFFLGGFGFGDIFFLAVVFSSLIIEIV